MLYIQFRVWLLTVTHRSVEPVEAHHRRLHEAVTESKSCRAEGAGWTRVDLNVVSLVEALLLQLQVEALDYLGT